MARDLKAIDSEKKFDTKEYTLFQKNYMDLIQRAFLKLPSTQNVL